MNEREILGQNIQRYRLFKGIKAIDLAKKIDLSEEHLSKLENAHEDAKNIGLGYLIKIAKKLNVTIEELFMSNGNLLSLRFIISDHNIHTLREVAKIIKDLLEKK